MWWHSLYPFEKIIFLINIPTFNLCCLVTLLETASRCWKSSLTCSRGLWESLESLTIEHNGWWVLFSYWLNFVRIKISWLLQKIESFLTEFSRVYILRFVLISSTLSSSVAAPHFWACSSLQIASALKSLLLLLSRALSSLLSFIPFTHTFVIFPVVAVWERLI